MGDGIETQQWQLSRPTWLFSLQIGCKAVVLEETIQIRHRGEILTQGDKAVAIVME